MRLTSVHIFDLLASYADQIHILKIEKFRSYKYYIFLKFILKFIIIDTLLWNLLQDVRLFLLFLCNEYESKMKASRLFPKGLKNNQVD